MIEFYAEDSEVMVLGSILQKPELMHEANMILDTSMFIRTDHRELYDLCKELDRQNKLDLYSVIDLAKEKGIDDTYVRQLPATVMSFHLFNHHAEKVRDMAVLRKGKQAAMQVLDATHAEYERIEDYITTVYQSLSEIEVVKKNELVAVKEKIGPHLYEKFTSEKKSSPLLGLQEVDNWMNGIGRERLIVVAGRPGTGKTAFALRTARMVAKQEFGPVAMFSMEMSEGELIDRMLADLSGVGFSRLNRNEMLDDERERVREASRHLDNIDLFIDDTSRMDMTYISSQARQLKRKHGSLGLIVVDYLGLIERHQKHGESTSDAVGRITREAKGLARELQCSIMMLVQMNREIEKRGSRKPVLSDLRDSGNIEQDADMVMFLHRDENKSTDKISAIDLIVAKGRQTGLADFELAFYGEIQRMEMAAKSWQY